MTERFGPYELSELLGRGGMGEVWRAVDTRKARTVALKRLPAEMTGEREFEDRFRREAHAAARLTDPHVIPIHDFGEIDGRLFLDMRLVHGKDLGAAIESVGALGAARSVSVIEQVASALDAAHDDGLVHRDVKPSNVLLTPSKRTVGPQDFVYLIDFGIATGAALGTRLTQTGMAIGTAAYMAPERFTDGVDTDPRIDVYALGCVLHEALTGKPPFAGRDFPSLMYAHINTQPTAPSRVAGGLPRGFDDVVARALAKEPDERYARAGDLAEAARGALEDGSPAQRVLETQVPPRPPRP
ncbi:MAG TPA: serine/threonine-protein kinase, partial [Actinomycetospora sp.]|nr:serine/threonine-protein kinase [Actinomycetospora sp.]